MGKYTIKAAVAAARQKLEAANRLDAIMDPSDPANKTDLKTDNSRDWSKDK